MRKLLFREVLWGVAYKLGLDPEQGNFLTNQAIPIGTYIDQWVRRVYDGRDWPQLVLTHEFAPDANHIVRWDAIPLDIVPAPNTTVPTLQIGRVLKVYLVDPGTTDAPVAAHFTLRDSGIHVGHEHGSAVWVRYMMLPPRFTAETWLAGRTYQTGDVTYSYQTGDCYKSKSNGNSGHDPSQSFSSEDQIVSIPLLTETTVNLSPGSPGSPEVSKIIRLFVGQIAGGAAIANPPPADTTPGSLWTYRIQVFEDEVQVGTNADVVTDGIKTLATITTSLGTQLTASLGPLGYTVTANTTAFTIDLEKGFDFTLFPVYVAAPFTALQLQQQQLQAFVAEVAPIAPVRQVITLSLTNDQVQEGSQYILNFKDTSGNNHTISYPALSSDGAIQILSGLIDAIAASTDPFFLDVQSSIDSTTLVASFSTGTAVSLSAEMILPGSPWWELVRFP